MICSLALAVFLLRLAERKVVVSKERLRLRNLAALPISDGIRRESIVPFRSAQDSSELPGALRALSSVHLTPKVTQNLPTVLYRFRP